MGEPFWRGFMFHPDGIVSTARGFGGYKLPRETDGPKVSCGKCFSCCWGSPPKFLGQNLCIGFGVQVWITTVVRASSWSRGAKQEGSAKVDSHFFLNILHELLQQRCCCLKDHRANHPSKPVTQRISHGKVQASFIVSWAECGKPTALTPPQLLFEFPRCSVG